MREEDEKTSVAPPRASIAPASLSPPRPSAPPPPPPATATRTSPAWLLVVALIFGIADCAIAARIPRASLLFTLALTLLVPFWTIVALRKDPHARLSAQQDVRRFIYHLANLLLVLSFVVAKWLVLIHMLEETALYVGSYRSYTVALILLLVLGLLLRGDRIARLVAASADHPARVMAASFGLVSLLGALLLSLPVSVHDVSDVSLLDALFMSVSAVCVTGLTTVNVADTYTFTGQVVLVGLMQVGGLGIMVLTAAVTMLAGRRLGVKSSAVLAEMVDATSLADLRRTITIILAYTLVFEAIGAGVLYWILNRYPRDSFLYYAGGELGGSDSAIWAAIFHSVSAFCNGSLSNFRGGLVPFANSPLFCQTILVLIVLGGTGFPVIHEVLFRVVDRLRGRRPVRLTLNTRVAATTGLALFIAIAMAAFALEYNASFAHLGTGARVNAALFHSACSRTSGFNLVDVSMMRPATLLLTCFAMFVGAGPGSTAGGIKTTTFAVLFAAFRAELRGQRARLFDRMLNDSVVRRAMGVAFLSTSLVIVVVFLLLLTDKQNPLALLFEAVSAFSTTGMSTGITPKLSVAGKLLLSITMLVGRIGPLTVALALSTRGRRATHELPEERVMIG